MQDRRPRSGFFVLRMRSTGAVFAGLFLCSVVGVSCARQTPSTPPAVQTAEAFQTEDVAALRARLSSEGTVQLIDVRTPQEYAEGHVKGSRNIPLDELEAAIDSLGTSTEPVYVICRSGNRSARASAMLASRGRKAVNIAGGMKAWEGAGFPVSR